MSSKDEAFLRRQGANFLSIINDLKRNRKAAAHDLGVSVDEIEKIISGQKDIHATLLDRAVQVWPVNRRDFMIIQDDAPEGVVLMRKDASRASSRIFSRGGSEYYEYRDTAMSRVAPFRPEWILELQETDGDPHAPEIQWNQGHFMHQFTLFINAVNFYYIEGNERRMMQAHTGDSMYITPFIPHTFATRRRDSEALYGGKKGLILALTYGNQLAGDTRHELSALGRDVSSQYLLNTSSRAAYFASLLKQQMDAMSMSPADAAQLTSLGQKRISELLSGEHLPQTKEYKALADLFNINTRDLMPPDEFDTGVITRFANKTRRRSFETYQVIDLASIRFLPYSKALILEVDQSSQDLNLVVPLHQYGYNFGDSPIRLRWQVDGQLKEDIIQPDDSFYMKPYIPHGFSSERPAKLLSLRIGGKGIGESQRELSHIGAKNVSRVIEESSLWYREEKD